MTWKTVYIRTTSTISCTNQQLLYKAESKQLSIPIEDISVLMLESLSINLTSYLMFKLLENNVCIFICNDKHLPHGIMLPFLNSARATEVAYLQQSISEPLRKRLWQKIIENKIVNQSHVFYLQGNKEGFNKLSYYANHIKLDDSENYEAVAAKFYWDKLFDSQFTRKSENKLNALLNYGYAIMRGVIARDLVSLGFFPCFSIHHCNKLNQYNLADDMIEPFRSLLDHYVFSNLSMFDFNEADILPTEKQFLIQFLDSNCYFKSEYIKVLNASSLTMSSLVHAIKNNNYKLLHFPRIKHLEIKNGKDQ